MVELPLEGKDITRTSGESVWFSIFNLPLLYVWVAAKHISFLESLIK